jgi:putative ABC transport system permease protein
MHGSIETIFSEIKESFGMAISAIRVNKLRSVLTLLGIAVGVFSIIAVMTAMGVLQRSIEEQMSSLGSHTFQVQRFPAFQMGGGDRAKYRNRKKILIEQGTAVKQQTTLAASIGLEAWQFGKTVKSLRGETTNPNIQICGEDVEGFVTNKLGKSRNLAILGQEVVTKLFSRINPIGEGIRIDGHVYTVIGVIESKGGQLGGNQDNFVAVPLTTFFNVYGKDRDVNIMVQALGADKYEDCMEQVRGIMRTARRVPPGAEDDFEMFSNDSIIKDFNDVTYYVRLGIMLISSIAIIAAGVGIMNIMLVSVTERTREIGIRKAIGARKKNILTQFIMEAIILSEVGGIIGIVLGILGGNIAAMLMNVSPVIPVDWTCVWSLPCMESC